MSSGMPKRQQEVPNQASETTVKSTKRSKYTVVVPAYFDYLEQGVAKFSSGFLELLSLDAKNMMEQNQRAEDTEKNSKEDQAAPSDRDVHLASAQSTLFMEIFAGLMELGTLTYKHKDHNQFDQQTACKFSGCDCQLTGLDMVDKTTKDALRAAADKLAQVLQGKVLSPKKKAEIAEVVYEALFHSSWEANTPIFYELAAPAAKITRALEGSLDAADWETLQGVSCEIATKAPLLPIQFFTGVTICFNDCKCYASISARLREYARTEKMQKLMKLKKEMARANREE